MTVRYRVQANDQERTEEQQALLLASAAIRVWRRWCAMEGGEHVSVIGQDEKLDDAIRALYQQIRETDVFYSGVQSGREDA